MRTIRLGLLLFALLTFVRALFAQITLTGTAYAQDFNTLDASLPAGWSVYTDASLGSLGTAASFTSTATSWSATTPGTSFRNISSDAGALASDGAPIQAANSNRAVGLRPLNAGTRDGAITLEISQTVGFENFSLSLRLFTANNVTNDQTYAVEYRLGNSGDFTQIGSIFSTGTPFGATNLTANSITLSALNNQSSSVFIRVRGTTGTSQSGNLDTLGLDDFSLTYSATAIPEPSTFATIFGLVVLFGVMISRRRLAKSA